MLHNFATVRDTAFVTVLLDTSDIPGELFYMSKLCICYPHEGEGGGVYLISNE